MAVTFNFQTRKFFIPKQKHIVDWILLVAFLEKRELDHISYVFCDDKYLLKLNRQFLKHNAYTDIITFDYSTKKRLSAEIYISSGRVKENALEFKTTFPEELKRVIIHGILHCIGYTDKTKRSQQIMRRKEDQYLLMFAEMEKGST